MILIRVASTHARLGAVALDSRGTPQFHRFDVVDVGLSEHPVARSTLGVFELDAIAPF